MGHTRVCSLELSEEYLNAHFYSQEFRSNESVLAACGYNRSTIESLSEKINCGATPKDVVYESSGCGLIRTSDVRPNCFFADKVLRTQRLNLTQGSATAAITGDVLYTMSGTIGYAATIPAGCKEVFSFSNTIARARIRKDKNSDSHYISAFFNSSFGYLQSRRLVSGGIQGHVMPNPFKKLLVITPHALAQKYIGDTVRQAERLREIAQNQIQGVTSTIDELTPVYDSIPKAISRVSPQRFGSRLDCQPYRTHFLALQAALETMTVNSLWEIADVLPGDPVPSDEFVRSGVPLVRIRDINAAGFQTAETFVSASYSQSRPAGSAKPNDIVIGMDGEFRAQLILAEDLPRHINQRIGIVRATGIAPELLSFWLNRTEGQFQLNQWSVKTTVDHTSLEYIRAVRIPRLSNRIEEQLASSLKRSSLANYYSKVCIDAAKLLVEALIERKVTEDELIHAQTRLEQGDDAADRAILSRLFEGGWDAKETRPLFPDLDAYYETLRMVEGEQTEAAAK